MPVSLRSLALGFACLGASALGINVRAPRASALVGITYWQPEHSSRPIYMKQTLKTLRSWEDIDMRIIVAVNKHSTEIEEFNVEQIVRPGRNQSCNETYTGNFCLTWNLVRSMRLASTGGSNFEEDFGKRPLVGDFAYDYYIYTESDIEIPQPTFLFWSQHADSFYKRGYLLNPVRLEKHLVEGRVKTTDCYLKDCVSKSAILRDSASDAHYEGERDRHWLQLWNPYPGCWFMTREMFGDYLKSPMSDYAEARAHSPWGLRETIAAGLIWDPRFNNKTYREHPGTKRGDIYGLTTSLSHVKMGVWHQVPMTTVGKGDEKKRITPDQFHDLYEFEDKVEACMKNSAGENCGAIA